MNPLTLLRSVEDLLYEVASWLIFYPRTLVMTLRHPIRTMDYSDREQRDKPEQQYLETLSPPLFLVLSLLLAHFIEIAVGLGEIELKSRLAASITHNAQALLAFRALLFSLNALAFAWLSLRLQKKRLDRGTLQAPFFAQCYLSGAMAILISLGVIGVRYPGAVATLVGVVVMVVVTGWYLAVQYRWLRARSSAGALQAACLSVAAFTLSTGLVFLISWSLA